MRWFLPITFLLAGLGLLGVGTWFLFAPSSGPSLEIAQNDVHLPDCAAGREMSVVYHLTNHSDRPLRILGLAGC